MNWILVLLILAPGQGDPKKYRDAVEKGVTFPPQTELDAARKKGNYYKTVVDLLTNLDLWAGALQAIDEKTGLYDGTLAVELKFGTLDPEPAMGGGAGG